MAIFKSKKAIFRHNVAIFRPSWHLRDRTVLINVLKWMIPDSIVQLFAANQMKIFLDRSMAFFQAMAMDLSKNIFIWSTAKSFDMESGMIHFNILFNTFQSLKWQRVPKMATFDLKMAILDLIIWSTAKSCAMEFGIIHFNILFNTFQSLKCQKGPKMAILDLKMAIDLSKNTFIWLTAKSCNMESGIIHFNNILSLKCQKGPQMAHPPPRWVQTLL